MHPDVRVPGDGAPVPPAATPGDPAPPRSRRALLAAALGGVAGAVASALGRPAETQGAAGDPLILGQQNFAGSSATRLSTSSSGGAFWMTQNGSGSGVRGESWNGTGGVFETHHADRQGLLAQQLGAAGTGAALKAVGGENTGVDATTSHPSKMAVRGITTSADAGAVAVHGEVQSASSGFLSTAVKGVNNGTATQGVGVYGKHASVGIGLLGESLTGYGVYGQSTGIVAIYGTTTHASGSGVYGLANGASGSGVQGYSSGNSGHGVYGYTAADSTTASAVYGVAAYGSAYAGYFDGKLHTTGTLSKAAGSFRIDHPLDPARRLLQHSFVESPDMKNVYDGVVTADDNGEATVELPAYFEALNGDVRYQLTAIGDAMPSLHVSRKLRDNRFHIAGAAPGAEVSWQVTGIRRDAYARAHPIEVELDKDATERGLYLHPLEHGQPASRGFDHQMRPQAVRPEFRREETDER